MSEKGEESDAMPEKDARTQEQRKVDSEYNELVTRFVGSAAVDVPMRDQLNTDGQGLVLVATDPSDIGYHHRPTDESKAPPISDERLAELAMQAVQFAFKVAPGDE